MGGKRQADRSAGNGPSEPQNEEAATPLAGKPPKATKRNSVSRPDVVRLLILRYTHAEIADELGHDRATITGIANEPEVAGEVARIRAEAMEHASEVLKSSTVAAAQRMARLINDPDPRVALDASKALLTKAGADAPTRGDLSVRGEMTPETAAAIVAVAKAKVKP